MGVFKEKQEMLAFKLPGGSEMTVAQSSLLEKQVPPPHRKQKYPFLEQTDVHPDPEEDLLHRWSCPEYEPTYIMVKVTLF